jgi:hypothetical protein
MAAKEFTEIFDPNLYGKPKPAPAVPASAKVKLDPGAIHQEPYDAAPEVTEMIRAGKIPSDMYDPRSEHEIFRELLEIGLDLDAFDIE